MRHDVEKLTTTTSESERSRTTVFSFFLGRLSNFWGLFVLGSLCVEGVPARMQYQYSMVVCMCIYYMASIHLVVWRNREMRGKSMWPEIGCWIPLGFL